MALAILLLALFSGVNAIPQSTGCSGNCLKALQNPTRAVDASSLCSSILETTLAPTAAADLPSWATQSCYGPLGPMIKLSKACSRFLTTVPNPSSTSPPSESTASSTCPTASAETITETITESAPVSSCPAASTITLPSTITESASIATVTTTTTTTETSVSITTTTTTTTVPTPSPSSCAQLLSDPSFSNPSRELFPWLGSQSPGGPASGGGLAETPQNPGSIFFVVRSVLGTTPETQNPFVRLTQGVSICPGTYTVRVRFQNRESTASSPGGWVFRANMRTMGGSLYSSEVYTAGTADFAWNVGEGVPLWSLASGIGEFWVDVVPVAPWDGDATIWVDSVELVRA